MKKQHKKALAVILAILVNYEIGGLILVIKSESIAWFSAWVIGQFPVFWSCWKIALSAEQEVKNGN